MTVATENLKLIQEGGSEEILRYTHPYALVMRVGSVNMSTKAIVPIQTGFFVELPINSETRYILTSPVNSGNVDLALGRL